MTKIQAMYKWSGGTDYCHTCHECKNCVRLQKGKRTVYKCLSYGNTDSEATDWKASYIACKAYGLTPPDVPVIEVATKKRAPDPNITGQMSIFDFIGEV